MKHIYTIILALLTISVSYAQENPTQILVFRNTGEVNLFFTSEIDSIVTSRINKNNVVNESVISQHFYTKDTCYVIPIAEIDSVAFGNRNVTEFKKDVRILTANDSIWIKGYNNHQLFYDIYTPENILPKEGEKLFYGNTDKLFPIGLMGKATKVSKTTNQIVVDVKDVELNEIFSRLFYADSLHNENVDIPQKTRKTRGPQYNEIIHQRLEIGLPINNEISINGATDFQIRGCVVANPLSNYYHMEGVVDIGLDLDIKGKTETRREVKKTKHLATIPLGRYAIVFAPELSLDAFALLNAQLLASLVLRRRIQVPFRFTQNNDETEDLTSDNSYGSTDETTVRSHLQIDGELMAGLEGSFNFNILRKMRLARLQVQLGPALSGTLSAGSLINLRNYEPNLYTQASLSASIKTNIEGFLCMRDAFLWGKEEELSLSKVSYTYDLKSFDLFPNFCETFAVEERFSNERAVSSSYKTDNEILHPVETGFEIIDLSGNVLDSVYVGFVESKNEVQGFHTRIPFSSDYSTNHYKVRPIFKYAGYTISAAPAIIRSGYLLQPVVFALANSRTNIVCGYPFLHERFNNQTYYKSGPYLPIIIKDPVFNDFVGNYYAEYITKEKKDLLLGTWEGETNNGKKVEYTFDDENKGTFTFNGETYAFIYTINEPQSGDIAIDYDDTDESCIISLLYIDNSYMRIRYKNTGDIITLNKK